MATLTTLTSFTASRLSTPDGNSYSHDNPGMAALFSSLTGAQYPSIILSHRKPCSWHDMSIKRPLCAGLHALELQECLIPSGQLLMAVLGCTDLTRLNLGAKVFFC